MNKAAGQQLALHCCAGAPRSLRIVYLNTAFLPGLMKAFLLVRGEENMWQLA